MLHIYVDVQTNRLSRVQGLEPERYVNNALQHEYVVSATKEVLPEHARKDRVISGTAVTV
jgi:hypothetical protein